MDNTTDTTNDTNTKSIKNMLKAIRAERNLFSDDTYDASKFYHQLTYTKTDATFLIPVTEFGSTIVEDFDIDNVVVTTDGCIDDGCVKIKFILEIGDSSKTSFNISQKLHPLVCGIHRNTIKTMYGDICHKIVYNDE